jgi:hypothetical protein
VTYVGAEEPVEIHLESDRFGRQKWLRAYGNCQNCPSDGVTIWVSDSENGWTGNACAISLDPGDALDFAQRLTILAERVSQEIHGD